ncbi:VWA domain-containing protein, partial [bacterium]|nr:VWA domain-containing protein [bacterium]MBU1503485.1 VWA domain-containing protein [bacterium]
ATASATLYDEDSIDPTIPNPPGETPPTDTLGDAPIVNITASDAHAVEGSDNTLIFTVSQTNLSDFDTTVNLDLILGTVEVEDITSITYTNSAGTVVTLSNATEIGNFVTNGDTVKIVAGQTSAPLITFTITDDLITEVTETLSMQISNTLNATLGTTSASATIADNDVPTTTDDSITLNEDTATALTIDDFGDYADSSGNSAALPTAVKIISLPTNGVLKLSGVDVVANDEISKIDIDAGNLVFTPASQTDDDSSFTFQLSDGVGYSATATTSVTVTAVADLPVVSIGNISDTGAVNAVLSTNDIAVDSLSQTVSATDGVIYSTSFGYSGTGSFQVFWGGELVEIALLDSSMATTVNVDSTMSQTLTMDLIGGSGDGLNQLIFVPTGTATIADIVMAPLENMIEYTLDLSASLNALELTANDGSETLTITLSGLPSGTSFTEGTAGTTAGTWVIPVIGNTASYTAMKMYVPESADTFTITATAQATETNDNGSGLNYQEASATATVTDLSLNNAPTATDDTVSGIEDTTLVLSVNDFGTYNDSNGDPFTAIKITGFSADNGVFRLLGHDLSGTDANISVGDEITLSDLALGNLVYIPNDNYSGIAADTLDFRVSDGRVWSDVATPYTTTVSITAVADMPSIGIDIGSISGTASVPTTIGVDDFSGGLNGWTGTNVSLTGGQMKVDSLTGASKTFTGLPASTLVTVTLDLNVYGTNSSGTSYYGWEPSGSGADKFQVALNGTDLAYSAFLNNSLTSGTGFASSAWSTNTGTIESTTVTFTATTNASGELALTLKDGSTAADEYALIDNIQFEYSSTNNIYPITITNALGVDTDGSEALGVVTLSNIPTNATVYADGVALTIVSGSTTLTQAQVSTGNITMQLPTSESQTFQLDVSVASIESSNGDFKTATAGDENVQVDVTPTSIDVSNILGASNNIPTGTNTNVVIMLDISGSMGNTESGMTGSRLDVSKSAIQDMLEAYKSIATNSGTDGTGEVWVKLTTFSTTATTYNWMSADAAIALINGLNQGGYTNYEDAVYQTYNGYTEPTPTAPTADDKTIGFFISDGEPTKENLEGRDVSGNIGLDAENGWLDSAYQTGWTDFANTYLDEANIIGIGTGLTNTTYLDMLAAGVTNSDVRVNSLLLKDPTELANMITPNVNTTIASSIENIIYGADGIGGLVSVVVNGTTYTSSFTDIDTGNGGQLSFDFIAGTYSYSTNSYVAADYQEVFAITIDDGDANHTTDLGSFDLKINVYESLETHTYTGSALDGGTGLDTMLLANSAGIDFDLVSNIANIEIIDLNANGGHALSNLSLQDVFNMTDANNEIRIIGDAIDSIISSDSDGVSGNGEWTQHSNVTETIDGASYTFEVYTGIYNDGTDHTVTLKIEEAINPSIV